VLDLNVQGIVIDLAKSRFEYEMLLGILGPGTNKYEKCCEKGEYTSNMNVRYTLRSDGINSLLPG